MAFLDETGVARLWEKIKAYVKANAGNVTVDSAFSTTSTNPVQNKVITNWLNNNILTWKVVSVAFTTGTAVTRTTEMATTITELLVCVRAGTSEYVYQFNLIPSKMAGALSYLSGYSTGAGASTYHGVCQLSVDWTNKRMTVKMLTVGNTSYSSGTLYLYYR